jgi:translation initiation factor IF-3
MAAIVTSKRKRSRRPRKNKAPVIFRGREITLSELGRAVLQRIVEETEEIAMVEQHPKFEGRILVMVLSPK